MKCWVLKLKGVDESISDILFKEDINGSSLVLLNQTELKSLGVPFGPAKLIIHARDEVVRLRTEEPKGSVNRPGGPCKPYPFVRYHDSHRYMEGCILTVTESGALDLIEPCHEFKAFTNTTEESKFRKFTYDVVRFGAACMNSRTNGTIHFGIGDKPEFVHGEVLGVIVKDKEAYAKALKTAVQKCFEKKRVEAAQKCIKHPRFVGLLNKNLTSSDKCVIEVDIVPDSNVCQNDIYHIFNVDYKKKQQSKQFYIRDGASIRNLEQKEREKEMFITNMTQLVECRKQAEEKHLTGIKSSTQGSRLIQMITGGSRSLDKSHFERYVIVTNKFHSAQFESLGFLVELDPIAVLDFDPESADNGLQHHFNEQSPVTVHVPVDYKITEAVEDIAKGLKLTRRTSWVFCNGGVRDEVPSEIDEWLMDKGASVRDVISFLCRKDVLPNKRFLVIFLLFSTMSEEMDPLVEAFSSFWQELKGEEQILCICDNEETFISWRDRINARCRIDISSRCIYELSFAEVSGTTLSLFSKHRLSSRFLPCVGEGNVLLEKKVERSLSTLEVLCMNQCEGGNDEKKVIEENFYKGAKVSWWNFYFSEEPGSSPFIKRDKFDFIISTIMQEKSSSGKTCALLNLMHLPGCGGTTLAMHVLWDCRKTFRCAVLRDNTADFAEIAAQVIQLLTYKREETAPQVPVLLLIDDFDNDDKEKVFELKQLIEDECVKNNIRSKSPQVILLNCMIAESSVLIEDKDTVFIGNSLSEKELELFAKKLAEIEKTHKSAQETFYGFMFMKENFSSDYAQRVARKTLKGFNINQKEAQLLAMLALLQAYCKGASLSVSLCEEFLDVQPQPVCGTSKVEDGFGKFSTLITSCLVESKIVFQGVKMIHSRIASHCLQELAATHNVTKADIAGRLLTTNKLYECMQGKEKLLQDVRYILVKRNYSQEEESQFSPLIHDIAKESPGMEEMVLANASKIFVKDAIVFQLLARYYYLKKRDYTEAKHFAKKAKELSQDNSFIADTSAQVIKHELKNAMAEYKAKHFDPENVKRFLKMAQSAIEAFKETQALAKKESKQRLQIKTDNSAFNTSGCLGEIQVQVLIIQVLEKTPVFSPKNTSHKLLSWVLSHGIEAVEKHDQSQMENKPYYMIFRQFNDLLSNLKYNMKVNIEFLDNFFVNLGSRFGIKDSREQVSQRELSKCFEKYAELFCKMDPAAHGYNPQIQFMYQLFQARQYLEKNKADTYVGILSCLSNNTTPDVMEGIVRQQNILLRDPKHTVKDRINFIYVNVVLSCIKLASPYIEPHQKVIDHLCNILHRQFPPDDTLPLCFIAVVLLWPQQNHIFPQSRNLRNYITQMKSSYHNVMKEVCNGKRPIIHFFLGKKQGYEKLVHFENIKRCLKTEPEQFSSMWEDNKIWRERRVVELLCRVTGVVNNNGSILVDTSEQSLRLEVTPVFRSQLSGHAKGSKVSFFVGFTLKGPVALDIN